MIMAHLIDKDTLIAEIEKRTDELWELLPDASKVENGSITTSEACNTGKYTALESLGGFIDTLEVKEMDLTDRKTEWCPSKKQMESLKDMLKWNIGDFDYQKWMEVKSLYDSLTKISDYEIDRQK